MKARGNKPFEAVADFVQRTNFSRRSVEWLIRAGSLDSFGERRQVLWGPEEALDKAKQPQPSFFNVPTNMK